jgi:hypothetical protein
MLKKINKEMEFLIRISDWIELSPRFRSFCYGAITAALLEYLVKH